MATSDIYRAPIGTKDVIGEESRPWQTLIAGFARRAHLYNYDLAITPTFENFEVFARIGEDTDVVSKEMYDFSDKGDRHIALRPEGTAGLVRAFAQHRPIIPFKAWYGVSNFRYERPQKGDFANITNWVLKPLELIVRPLMLKSSSSRMNF